MKFHLDENVDHAIADGLRRRGIDVTTSTETNLLAAEDESQLAFARREGRVIVSHDRDLLRLHSLEIHHRGIAYCASASRSIGQIVRHLLLMHECLAEAEVRGRIEYM
jgi:uncharacterized protein with PIN domain